MSHAGAPDGCGPLNDTPIITKEGRWRGLGSEVSLKVNTPMVLAAVASSAVEYPERQWIAQSVWHGEAVLLATVALRNVFRDREDVLVAMELVVYYERGDDTA